MAYKITDKCIFCDYCMEICPIEAIYEDKLQNVIDPEKCLDCGNCAACCPVEAITAPDEE